MNLDQRKNAVSAREKRVETSNKKKKSMHRHDCTIVYTTPSKIYHIRLTSLPSSLFDP